MNLAFVKTNKMHSGWPKVSWKVGICHWKFVQPCSEQLIFSVKLYHRLHFFWAVFAAWRRFSDWNSDHMIYGCNIWLHLAGYRARRDHATTPDTTHTYLTSKISRRILKKNLTCQQISTFVSFKAVGWEILIAKVAGFFSLNRAHVITFSSVAAASASLTQPLPRHAATPAR